MSGGVSDYIFTSVKENRVAINFNFPFRRNEHSQYNSLLGWDCFTCVYGDFDLNVD